MDSLPTTPILKFSDLAKPVVIKDFLSAKQVSLILEWLKDKPYVKTQMVQYQGQELIKYRNKNFNYHDPKSLMHRLLHKKVCDLLGEHSADSCSLMEGHFPFELHVDSYQAYKTREINAFNKAASNLAVLICLNEHPLFKTVYFDHFTPEWLPDQFESPNLGINEHDVDLSHLDTKSLEVAKSLKISRVVPWQVGTAIVFRRDQLHCASNFFGNGLTKMAVTLFL